MTDSQPFIGQTVSHYCILKKLGEGGMGEVYLAEDSALNRTVALKFLLPKTQADETARKRLLAEARAAAALDHPFICKVYEAGEAGGWPFIAMEYVEGSTLADRMVKGALPFKEALHVAVEIAEALECAHQRGIVHRDLKPSNILLTRDGHVKVMDFGLAKRTPLSSIGSEKTVTQTLTEAGTTLGTLAYMSPEQLKGEMVDARSDIFAFGVLLYEMVAGVHPFLKDSPFKTANAVLEETPAAIPSRGKEPPELFHHTIKRTLAKDREQRYQSIREVRTNLVELREEPRPRLPGLLTVVRMLRPLWLTVLILAMVFGLAGATFWVFENYFHSPRAALAFQKRDWIVMADFENQTGDPVFDRSLQTALRVGIEQSQYVNVLPPARVQEGLARMRKEGTVKLDEQLASDLAVREGAKAVLACSIAELGGNYLLTARLLDPNTRATVLTESMKAAGKKEVLPALDSLSKTVRQKLGESLASVSQQGLPLPKATTASLEALKTYTDGKKLAATNVQAGFDLIQQAVVMDPDFALAHADLGAYYYNSNRRTEGEEHFVKALSLLDRLTLREKLWIPGFVEDWRGNREAAVNYYEAYLAQYPDDNEAWFRLGWAYMAALHQPEKAIPAFKRVLEINPKESGAYINLATCYGGIRQNEKALENYEKAFQINPSEITGPFVNNEYGFLLVRMGDLPKAADTFHKMLSETQDWKKARGYRSLALLAMYQGKYSEAISNLKEALLLEQAIHALESEYRERMFLAAAYRTKGRGDESAAEVEAATKMLSKAPFGPTWIMYLAKTYARMGKIAEATKLLNDMVSQQQSPTAIAGINRSGHTDEAAIYVVKGEIALAAGKGSEAVEAFEVADKLVPHNFGMEPLAFGLRVTGKTQEAARAYQEIVDQVPLGSEGQESWVLAHYELGKIYQELGDTAKARQSYGELLDLWKDGDEDLPVLRQAKAAAAKLQN